MNNKIGFSVIYLPERDDKFYASLFEDMLATGCRAIELHVPRHNQISPTLINLIRKFDYRAIHTSDLRSAVESREALTYYKELAQLLDAEAITIHPHTMQTWGWIAEYFGNQASFENMDCFKPFGKTPEDMQRIKSEHPRARWTFDINHVLTNDESLGSIPDFYTQLGNPGHYHISGFRDELLPHTTLHTTHQDEIIHAIVTDVPVIIESLGIADIHLFRNEYDYVVEKLENTRDFS